MSEPELIDANDTPWGKLIYWSNEEVDTPTRRWNLMQSVLNDTHNEPYGFFKEYPSDINTVGLFPDFFKEIEAIIGMLISELPLPSFRKFMFKSPVSFCNAIFYNIDFQEAIFKEKTTFEHSIFYASADFSSAKFCKEANFENLNFLDEAVFSACAFRNFVFFINSNFKKGANFSGTYIKGANFENSTFGGLLNFNESFLKTSLYARNISADAGISMKSASIGRVKISKKVENKYNDLLFSGSRISEGIAFHNAKIYSRLYLNEMQGELSVNFSSTNFINSPPKFHKTDLHPESTFRNAIWPKENYPYLIDDYENLRIIAEKLGKLEDRKIFIQREMECRYHAAERWSVDWMWRGLYRAVSYHGTSVGRPFCIMACLFMFSLYFWIKWGVQTGQIGVFDALMLHFQQIMPLPRYDLLDLPKTLPDCLIFSASFLRVISFPAWFLIGLALRHRFRMG